MKTQSIGKQPETIQLICKAGATSIATNTAVFFESDGITVTTVPNSRPAGKLVQYLAAGQFGYTQIFGVMPDGTFINGFGGGSGGSVDSVFGRVGDVVAVSGDYSSFYPTLAGAFPDPSWITSLNAAKLVGISGAPSASTFLRGDLTWAAPVASAAQDVWLDASSVAGLSTIVIGTAPQRLIVATFSNGANNSGVFKLTVPAAWNSNIAFKMPFQTTFGDNTKTWTVEVSTAFVAAGGDIVSPVYNSPQSTVLTNPATATEVQYLDIANLTSTGAAAGETMFIKITEAAVTGGANHNILGINLSFS